MKTVFILLFFFGAFFLCSSCKNSGNSLSGNIPIVMATDHAKISEKIDSIKKSNYSGILNHQVMVFRYRSDSTFNTYHIIFFHTSAGRMMHHQASASDSVIFMEANYQWKNDTIVEIRLANPIKGTSRRLTLFGNATCSGIIQNDKE